MMMPNRINEAQITKNTILLKSSSEDSLDVDSLDLVELILTFEEAFKIDISDEDAGNLLVVQDIVDYVAVALEKKEEEYEKIYKSLKVKFIEEITKKINNNPYFKDVEGRLS